MLHFCEKLSLGKLTFSEKFSSSIEHSSQVHAWHLIHKSLLIQNLSPWVENPLIRDFYFPTNLLTFSGWNLVNVNVNVIFLHTAYNIRYIIYNYSHNTNRKSQDFEFQILKFSHVLRISDALFEKVYLITLVSTTFSTLLNFKIKINIVIIKFLRWFYFVWRKTRILFLVLVTQS